MSVPRNTGRAPTRLRPAVLPLAPRAGPNPRRRPRCRPRRSSARPPAASCSPRSGSGCSSTSSCPVSRPASTPCSSSPPRSPQRPSSPGRPACGGWTPSMPGYPIAALAFAAMPGVRTDDWLVTADLLLAGVLSAGAIACLAGGRITRGLVPAILTLATGPPRRGDHRRDPDPRRGPSGSAGDDADAGATRARLTAGARRATPVLRGLLLALPVVALFAILFASADAVFAELARSTLDLATRPRSHHRRRPHAVGRRRGVGHGRPAGHCGRRPARARPRWHRPTGRAARPMARRCRPTVRRLRRGGPGARWAPRAPPRCGSRCDSARSRRRRSCGWWSRCSPRSSCSSSPTCSAAATPCRSPVSRTRTTRGAGSSSWWRSRCWPGCWSWRLDLAVARRGRAQLVASLGAARR